LEKRIIRPSGESTITTPDVELIAGFFVAEADGIGDRVNRRLIAGEETPRFGWKRFVELLDVVGAFLRGERRVSSDRRRW